MEPLESIKIHLRDALRYVGFEESFAEEIAEFHEYKEGDNNKSSAYWMEVARQYWFDRDHSGKRLLVWLSVAFMQEVYVKTINIKRALDDNLAPAIQVDLKDAPEWVYQIMKNKTARYIVYDSGQDAQLWAYEQIAPKEE